ncbi:MAG: hemolysin activation protein, partial [Paludibacteraceae bacterium]|nr:hemolysin activation protein [Paludibacteraceae bacterium]
MKHPWEIDVNVLIIFFVRDEVLKKTFEAVKKARPRRLLLWQDGPREDRADDLEGIERCRKIVEDIDWDCEVYTTYNEKNIGCDPSIYYAYKWAFTKVDKCIFLEDDQVPNQSYFRFCKELLDKYENDTRISHICGYNYTEIAPDCETDYLFAPFGSGAWATWKRVVDEWEEDYGFLSQSAEMEWVKQYHGKL